MIEDENLTISFNNNYYGQDIIFNKSNFPTLNKFKYELSIQIEEIIEDRKKEFLDFINDNFKNCKLGIDYFEKIKNDNKIIKKIESVRKNKKISYYRIDKNVFIAQDNDNDKCLFFKNEFINVLNENFNEKFMLKEIHSFKQEMRAQYPNFINYQKQIIYLNRFKKWLY